MEQILLFLQPLLELYGGDQGWLVQAVSIIGSLRIFMKPAMSLFLAYVTFTPNTKDNDLYMEIEKGNTLKMLLYFLDWTASIKFKKK